MFTDVFIDLLSGVWSATYSCLLTCAYSTGLAPKDQWPRISSQGKREMASVSLLSVSLSSVISKEKVKGLDRK